MGCNDHISCFEMPLMLGEATQECGFKHCQKADYRRINVSQTTPWEVQKARVVPSPLMVIMNFVFHVRLFSPFRRSLSSWRTRERLCLHQVKFLLGVHWMLLAESFEPRPNRCELGTAGSVMTIGLSINECLHSKKPESKIDICRSSGCDDFKGWTRFRQSLLKISSIIKKWLGDSSRRMTCFTCM